MSEKYRCFVCKKIFDTFEKAKDHYIESECSIVANFNEVTDIIPFNDVIEIISDEERSNRL